MSDAKTQSIEKCKYRHNWELISSDADDPKRVIRCRRCSATPKLKESDEAEAIVKLRIENTYDRKREALRVGGCGMDMGFHVVYNLSRVLYPDGFVCVGKDCRSNDHFNDHSPAMRREAFAGKRHVGDGGYALNHRWM